MLILTAGLTLGIEFEWNLRPGNPLEQVVHVGTSSVLNCEWLLCSHRWLLKQWELWLLSLCLSRCSLASLCSSVSYFDWHVSSVAWPLSVLRSLWWFSHHDYRVSSAAWPLSTLQSQQPVSLWWALILCSLATLCSTVSAASLSLWWALILRLQPCLSLFFSLTSQSLTMIGTHPLQPGLCSSVWQPFSDYEWPASSAAWPLCSSVSAAILNYEWPASSALCSSVSDICLSLRCFRAAALSFAVLAARLAYSSLSPVIYLPFVLLSLKHDELSPFLFFGNACWLWSLQIQRIVLKHILAHLAGYS